jgi:hypothetical protein
MSDEEEKDIDVESDVSVKCNKCLSNTIMNFDII